MKKQLRLFIDKWKNDYPFKTAVLSAGSALIGVFFTVYNGILGIIYHSIWNGSICIYYCLLTSIRFVIVGFRIKETTRGGENTDIQRKKIYFFTHIFLFLINFALLVPIAIMIKGNRSFPYGLIPAITMAAYTTYRITTGIIHLRKSGKLDNYLNAELRTINMIDSLVSLLTLQNALIMSNGGMNGDMQLLSTWSSAAILALIIAITLRSFLKIKLLHK